MMNSKAIVLLVTLLVISLCSAAPYEADNGVHTEVDLDITGALQRVWKGVSCLGACRSSWGWTGNHFGADSWGGVLKAGDPVPYSDGGSNDQSNSPDYTSSQSIVESTSSTDDGFGIQDVTLSADAIPTSTVSFSVFIVPTLITTTSSSTTPTTTAAPITTSSQDPSPTPDQQAQPSPDPQPQTSSDPQPQTTQQEQAPATSSATPSSNSNQAGTPDSIPQTANNQGSTSSSDQDQYLQAHNSVRSQHGANDLTWSNDLEGTAQEWANNCQFMHSGGRFGSLGENLAAGTGTYTIPEMVNDWVQEISEYDPNNPVPSHFTQVVWKGSTQVGCAKATCSGIFPGASATFYVCQYSPAGNVIGQFAENVQK